MTAWWLCPNEPRCPHGDVLHDRDDWDDPSPTCCVDGCSCGHKPQPGARKFDLLQTTLGTDGPIL